MRYYRVTAKRGHCGTGQFMPITFGFCAENIMKAMDMAKMMPSVKHTAMILEAHEISWPEYRALISTNAYNRAEGRIENE